MRTTSPFPSSFPFQKRLEAVDPAPNAWTKNVLPHVLTRNSSPPQPSTKRTFVLCRLHPRRWVEITFRFALPDKYIIIRLMTWFAHFLSIYLLLIYISLSPTRFSYIGCFIHRLAEHCRKCVASPTLQQKKKTKNPHTHRCFLSASTPLLQLLPNRR